MDYQKVSLVFLVVLVASAHCVPVKEAREKRGVVKDMLISGAMSGVLGKVMGGDAKKSAAGGAMGAGAMHMISKVLSG